MKGASTELGEAEDDVEGDADEGVPGTVVGNVNEMAVDHGGGVYDNGTGFGRVEGGEEAAESMTTMTYST